MKYTAKEIVEAIGSGNSGLPESQLFAGYSIDSRSIKPNELFFAITGLNQDGHAYVEQAFDNGGSGAVVRHAYRRPGGETDGLLFCDDPLQALHDLASASRQEPGLKLIGITGSCGKTTVKDLAAALIGKSLKTGKNEGNYNNIWSMPVAFLRRPPGLDVYICEMGMSFSGELRQIAKTAKPDIAVFTNIHAVHLVNFHSIQEIASAKAEILEGLPANGSVVANADDPVVMKIARQSKRPLLTFGFSQTADIRAIRFQEKGIAGSTYEIDVCGTKVAGEFHLPGKHNLYNLMTALACGVSLGLAPGTMLRSLADVKMSPLRSDVIRFPEGWTVFNDAYNSNPPALKYVLSTIATSVGFQRKIIVLADMLELGVDELHEHSQCGNYLAKLGCDLFIAIGPLMSHMADTAIAAGLPAFNVIKVESSSEALQLLKAKIRPGDLILVKGSRGMKLETIINEMAKQDKPIQKAHKPGLFMSVGW